MSGFGQACKRLLDVVVVIAASPLVIVITAIISIGIRLGSSGPAIFTQERAGKDGKPFVFYKFRTMKIDVDPFGASPKSSEDARLTKIGKLLREYSLDELPQLVNILKGDMSIVGPRPLYVSQIAEWDERQKKRLLVKPGLTGLAQISGRAELTREEKLELDAKYAEKAGFWLDLKIILATTVLVFERKNIYEKRYSRDENTRGENK